MLAPKAPQYFEVVGLLQCQWLRARIREGLAVTCVMPGCLAAVVDNSLSGVRVARELDRIAEMRGLCATRDIGDISFRRHG